MASFLMCNIDRRAAGKSQKGRSYCPACKHNLSPWELVPIISYFFLKGNCRNCKTAISPIYPIGELFLALVFALAYELSPNLPIFLWHAFVAGLLFYIAYVDFKVKVVEDGALGAFLAAILVHSILGLGPDWRVRLIGTLVLGLSLYVLWRMKPEGIGFGDVLFSGMMGMILGPIWGARAFLIGIIFALTAALILISKGKAHGKTALPLLPFLGAGTWIVLMLQLWLL